MRKFITLIMCLIVFGCTKLNNLVHKIDIPQGNDITPKTIANLKLNMNKLEVAELLGTPMLVDTFHQNRWDYYYSMQSSQGITEHKHLMVKFADDTLISFENL